MDVGDTIVIHAELLIAQDDFNGFINYIFRNLESDNWFDKYIYCTRYPNWDWKYPEVGDKGYVVITPMHGGKTYFNVKSQAEEKIQQDHNRFEKFLEEPKTDKYIM